ncbi:MAG: AEC family transporter, partial [Cardiobacteriaceae bacterium]|nr:AEC family transporter [Cardiobacteriaceae bacterium]
MLNIITALLPIFIVIAFGYAATRAGAFTLEGLTALGRFVISIALPALIFKALSEKSLGEVLIPAYLFGYAVATILCFAIGLAISRLLGQDLQGAAVTAIGQTYSNSAFVGYPLLLGVIGGNAGVYFSLNTMVENVLLVPLFLALAESHAGGKGSFAQRLGHILLNMLRKPLIFSLILGMIFSAFHWRLPAPLDKAISLVAGAAAPVAIFVIGCGLNGIRLQGNVIAITQITIGKLVLMPALAALFIWLFKGNNEMIFAGALMGGISMANTVAIFAQHYGYPNRGTVSMITTNVLSVFTLSAI